MIDKTLAQQIVDATKQVVDKDINFINQDGMIIGSSNSKRIGTYHEAGHVAYQNGKVMSVENENHFAGTKQGVNYPIVIDGQVIGVIGITGDPAEVTKFGFLASKITEILFKEKQMSSSYDSRKQMIRYLMNTFMNDREIKEVELKEVLDNLGVRGSDEYICLVFELDKSNLELVRVQNKLRNFLKSYNIELYVYTYPNQFTILIPERIYQFIQKLKHTLESEFSNTLHCGVGGKKKLLQMQDSYHEALTALKYAKQLDKVYLNYNKLGFQLIIEEISDDTKLKYVEKMIGKLDEEDIGFLNYYYTYNMSLKDCAEAMFIHKNTVQYRLEKIYRKTGLNPRLFKDSALIYLALILKNERYLLQMTEI